MIPVLLWEKEHVSTEWRLGRIKGGSHTFVLFIKQTDLNTKHKNAGSINLYIYMHMLRFLLGFQLL